MLSNILQVDLSAQEGLLPETDDLVDPRYQYTRLQYGLTDHANHIMEYHPDGTGIGETVGCSCKMCERVQPFLLVPERLIFDNHSRYLKRAAHVFHRLFESMTLCDQRNVQRLVSNQCGYVSCDTKITEMGPNTNPGCSDCKDFYSMFAQALEGCTYGERALLRYLLESKTVSTITYKDLPTLTSNPIYVLSHVLYYATADFHHFIHAQIFTENQDECYCDGCIKEREYEDWYYEQLGAASQKEAIVLTAETKTSPLSDEEDDNEFVTKYIQPYMAAKALKQ